MNHERRKALGNVFFDVSKYLLTSIAVGTFIVQNINTIAFAASLIASFVLMALAYYITPKDKEGN